MGDVDIFDVHLLSRPWLMLVAVGHISKNSSGEGIGYDLPMYCGGLTVWLALMRTVSLSECVCCRLA